MTPNRRLRHLAAPTLALVALIGAGCGSGAGSETTTGGAAADGTSAAGQAKAVKFSECLRSNGVPHFPDPNAKGEYEFGVDVSATIWRKAVAACKDLQPPGSLSSERDPKEQKHALTFAECVRANGVKDFPDPVDGEPLIDTYKIPSANREGGMTILNAAIAKCRDRLDDAIAGQ